MSLKHLDRIARALDGCTNLRDEPLGPEYRARIFATVESPTAATWQSARSIFVAGSITLWQAVISTGLAETAIPTGVQIVGAIEAAVYRTPAL